MIKISSTPINAHMDTSDRGLSHNFIDPGAVAYGLRGLKTRWCRVSSFSITTEYTRALSLPTYKKTRRADSGERRGAVPKILFVNKCVFFSFFV